MSVRRFYRFGGFYAYAKQAKTGLTYIHILLLLADSISISSLIAGRFNIHILSYCWQILSKLLI